MRELSQEMKDTIYNWNKEVNALKKIDMQYFSIDIQFIIPRAWYSRIFLDSIIWHHIFYSVMWSDAYNLSFDYDRPVNLSIPLAKEQWNNTFFHNASCINTIPEYQSYKTKRFLKSMPESIDTRRISTQVGQTKSYLLDVQYDTKMNYRLFWKWDISLIKKVLPEKLYIWKSTAIWYWLCEYEIKVLWDWKKSFAGLLDYHKALRPLPVWWCQLVWLKPKGEYTIERLPIHMPYFGKNADYYDCYIEGTEFIFEKK